MVTPNWRQSSRLRIQIGENFYGPREMHKAIQTRLAIW